MGGRGRHRRQYAPSEIRRVTVMAGSPRLEFRDVAKRFANPRANSRQGGGYVVAGEAVSLSIAEGEVVSLIGPPGGGKRTLLNMAPARVPPASGRVRGDRACLP